ncbi:MAG: GT4 family glycosyltransferase PelF [Deltaproteobacteria bacterium]|nr:GT4 family glycosyltransferase PelF [Deltaproteobacteria bacterium]
MNAPGPPAVPPTSTEEADVCLLLEGTYPYIRGGVSAWVHQIISKLPELKFSAIFLGGARSDYAEMKYQLPSNFIHLETHYLSESWRLGKASPRPGNRAYVADSAKLHDYFKKPAAGLPPGLLERLLSGLGQKSGLTRDDFLFSDAVWEQVSADFNRYSSDPSFTDYFWTVRIMHAPLFMLADITRQAPPAKVYHSISTGYAGLLGSFLAKARGRPLILSEHGIYTKERKIDLAQADWIKDAEEIFGGGLEDDVSYIRRLWIRFFEGIGRLTYEAADPIVALYEGNRQRQIRDGAVAERTTIVPNGINLERFDPVRAARGDKVPPVLGLIGRVVPIKDIKTFIRAMHTVVKQLPEAEGWIVGPEDEDRAYAAECHALVASLGLEQKVKFLGFQNVADILPKLGLMVLTSISEALPLVVVEGYAAGVPAVVTDVGSCRELIEGRTPEDKALGVSGAVVNIADPEATGKAAARLLSDEQQWKRAQQAGLERVRRFYTEPMMIGRYRELYQEAIRRPGRT